ncbi:MAG: hotdog fold thioesterase [Prolixibacteraceae bacterium]|nr:hotdog fold thioesterase [Prolixibacteraceae bacterium]
MTISEINEFCKNSLVGHLNIEFINVTATTIQAKMPVHTATHQPMGYLHGGASLALAETVGSGGSLLHIDATKYDVFGMQVSANHISPVKDGYVVATATLLHEGKKTHVWDVEIRDRQNKLISVARVTNAIVEKKSE